jgi:hypothetical protein
MSNLRRPTILSAKSVMVRGVDASTLPKMKHFTYEISPIDAIRLRKPAITLLDNLKISSGSLNRIPGASRRLPDDTLTAILADNVLSVNIDTGKETNKMVSYVYKGETKSINYGHAILPYDQLILASQVFLNSGFLDDANDKRRLLATLNRILVTNDLFRKITSTELTILIQMILALNITTNAQAYGLPVAMTKKQYMEQKAKVNAYLINAALKGVGIDYGENSHIDDSNIKGILDNFPFAGIHFDGPDRIKLLDEAEVKSEVYAGLFAHSNGDEEVNLTELSSIPTGDKLEEAQPPAPVVEAEEEEEEEPLEEQPSSSSTSTKMKPLKNLVKSTINNQFKEIATSVEGSYDNDLIDLKQLRFAILNQFLGVIIKHYQDAIPPYVKALKDRGQDMKASKKRVNLILHGFFKKDGVKELISNNLPKVIGTKNKIDKIVNAFLPEIYSAVGSIVNDAVDNEYGSASGTGLKKRYLRK